MLKISPTAKISPLADIEESRRGTLIEVGDHVAIDSFVKIKPAGGNGALKIGPGTTINSGCVFYTGNGIVIGRDCAIAANCTFAPANHAIDDRDVPIVKQGFMPSRGGIRIEDDVWIGANVVLLDGALLRRGCVIGAGSVVRGEIPPYAVCAGAPARIVRYRGDRAVRRLSERVEIA
jgi:acetyltransferase-like isoleucine patch superfamily enzyme